MTCSIAALAGVAEREAGLASGLNNTMFQIGAAVGTAIVSTVAFSRADDGRRGQPLVALTEGFQAGFAACIVLAAVGLVFALGARLRGRAAGRWSRCPSPRPTEAGFYPRGVPYETAREQWEAGMRRLDEAFPEQAPTLERVTREVHSELRRRLGGPFTLDELADLYDEGTGLVHGPRRRGRAGRAVRVGRADRRRRRLRPLPARRDGLRRRSPRRLSAARAATSAARRLCRSATVRPMRLSLQTLRVLQVFMEDPGEPRYGLELMDRDGAQERDDRTPALHRLESEGWLRSWNEPVDSAQVGRPARRLYALTPTAAGGRRERARAVSRHPGGPGAASESAAGDELGDRRATIMAV